MLGDRSVDDFQNISESEKINQLLIKCIDCKNNLASCINAASIKDLEKEETRIKRKLENKYHALRQQQQNNKLIQIKLFVEKTSSSCQDPVDFDCNLLWSIRTTKHQILKHFGLFLPTESLLVICQGKIVKDWQSLQDCGITSNGDLLHVYVVEEKKREVDIVDESDNSNELDLLMKRLNLSETDSLIEIEYASISLKTEHVNCNSKNNIDFELEKESKTQALVENPVQSNSVNIEAVTEKPNKNDQSLKDDSANNTTMINSSVQSKQIGWQCLKCTYINEPTRPGCQLCSNPRPDDYVAPEDYVPSVSEVERLEKEQQSEEMTLKMQEETKKHEAETRKKNYQKYLLAHNQQILENNEPVDCSICLTEAGVGEAVQLADCLHVFCKDCLSMHIMLSEQLPVKCPFVDDNYNCSSPVLEREIRGLLSKEKFQAYLRKSLGAAETQVANSFHCKTPDCYGWCEYDDGVNKFECPVCEKLNCLTCKAIHENLTCKEYQEQVFAQSSTNKQAKKTKKLLKKLVKKKDAMHCPNCNIIILKKEGCDWVRCTMCSLEICWVTQKPRWGPDGQGDTSGGCQCGENGVKCHPKCVNCH